MFISFWYASVAIFVVKLFLTVAVSRAPIKSECKWGNSFTVFVLFQVLVIKIIMQMMCFKIVNLYFSFPDVCSSDMFYVHPTLQKLSTLAINSDRIVIYEIIPWFILDIFSSTTISKSDLAKIWEWTFRLPILESFSETFPNRNQKRNFSSICKLSQVASPWKKLSKKINLTDLFLNYEWYG